jgi:hypothetical protein
MCGSAIVTIVPSRTIINWAEAMTNSATPSPGLVRPAGGGVMVVSAGADTVVPSCVAGRAGRVRH